MIKNRFYKLKRKEGNQLHVPKNKRVSFGKRTSGSITGNDVSNAFQFAYDMSFGRGHHRAARTGGSHNRANGEIFANTFQGKLSEIAVYNELMKNDIECGEVDFVYLQK